MYMASCMFILTDQRHSLQLLLYCLRPIFVVSHLDLPARSVFSELVFQLIHSEMRSAILTINMTAIRLTGNLIIL